MLRTIIIILALIGIPFTIYFATQFGQLEDVTFSQAMEVALAKSETDQTKNVRIRGTVFTNDSLTVVYDGGNIDFYMQDNKGKVFHVTFDGKESKTIPRSKQFSIIGHVHGGSSPYFHAKQIILD
jgi:hypothetical protein